MYLPRKCVNRIYHTAVIKIPRLNHNELIKLGNKNAAGKPEKILYKSIWDYFSSGFILFQMKTVSVALVLCLNVGVDPPDVLKTSPCARLECWIGR